MNVKNIGLAVMVASSALAPWASAQVAVAPEPPTLEWAQAAARTALTGAQEERTKEALSTLRAALSVYYGDKMGRYPASLAELVPAYIPAIPAAVLPGTGHAPSARVVIITEDVRDFADLKRHMTDAGGWIYVANPRSPMDGVLQVNCLHSDSHGWQWGKY